MEEGYDFNSVMHYPDWAFSVDQDTIKTVERRQKTITPKTTECIGQLGQRHGFSPSDIRQINKLFKCPGIHVATTEDPLKSTRPTIKPDPTEENNKKPTPQTELKRKL